MIKKCPFCAEEIQQEAIKCRWCGEFFDAQAKPKVKWYSKGSTLFMGFLVAGPLVLPLVWANRSYSTTKKIVISALIILVTLALMKGFALIVQKMDPVSEYMKLLNQ